MPYADTPEGTLKKRASFRRWYHRTPDNAKRIMAYNTTRSSKIKTQLVNALGGKYTNCGYQKCITALDFHHIGQKDSTISVLIQRGCSFERILKEANKCKLLCSNCHREYHHNARQKIYETQGI